MIVIYLNDQTKNFPTKIEEIIFLGPLFLKDVTFGNDDIIPKKEMGKEIAKINLSNITKIDDSSFPAFNGDLVNKKGQNNFNLLNIGKPMTVYKPTMDTKGRVIGGYQTLELTDNNLEGVSHSKLTYDNTDVYRTGYAHTKFTKGLNTNNYLTTNKTNNITKAIEIVPSNLDNDFVLNDASLTTIEEELTPGYVYGIMKRDYDKYGIYERSIDQFNNIGAKPWLNQRNFVTKDPTVAQLSVEPTPFKSMSEHRFLDVAYFKNIIMIVRTKNTGNTQIYWEFYKVTDGIMEVEPYHVIGDIENLTSAGYYEYGVHVINGKLFSSWAVIRDGVLNSHLSEIEFDKNMIPTRIDVPRQAVIKNCFIDNKAYGSLSNSFNGFLTWDENINDFSKTFTRVVNASIAHSQGGVNVQIATVGSKVYCVSDLNNGAIQVNEHFNGVIYKDWTFTDYTINKRSLCGRFAVFKNTMVYVSKNPGGLLSVDFFKFDKNGDIIEHTLSKTYSGAKYSRAAGTRLSLVSTGKRLYIFMHNEYFYLDMDLGFVNKDFVLESQMTYKNLINF